MPVAIKITYDDDDVWRAKLGRFRDYDPAYAALVRKRIKLPSGRYRWSQVRVGPRPLTAPCKSWHSRFFLAAARYLISPSDDEHSLRVAWAESINIPGFSDRRLTRDEVVRAADWMAETAALNTTAYRPAILHYVISFDPKDRKNINRRLLRRVGREAIKRLKMTEHQALIVCHKDKAHPHLHIVLNRIHPVTAKPHHPWRDLLRLEQLMRQTEQFYGLRSVQGRHYDLQGQPLEPNAVRPPKRRRSANDIVALRAKLDRENPFQEANTWDDLLVRLRKHGLRLRRRENGLRLVDVETGRSAETFKVFGPDAKYEKLVGCFGEPFEAWQSRINAAKGIRSEVLIARNRQPTARKNSMLYVSSRARGAEQQRREIAMARRLLRFPAREASTPHNWPPIEGFCGPAAVAFQIRTAVQRSSWQEVRDWWQRSMAAKKKIDNVLAGASAIIDRGALEKASQQIQRGLETVERAWQSLGDRPVLSPSDRASQSTNPPADKGVAPNIQRSSEPAPRAPTEHRRQIARRRER